MHPNNPIDPYVEWYEETLDPASILCSELAKMEGVTQGFIYASDDICTEADLAEVEALINDETLLHVYLKPCGGEDRRSREGRRIIHHKNAKEIKSLWNTEYVPYIAGIWQSFNPGNSSFKIKAHLVNFEL